MLRFTPLITGLFLILLLVSPTASARTLEKREEADPVIRLKQDQQTARQDENQTVGEMQKKINGLETELSTIDKRLLELKDHDPMAPGVLDEMHELVGRKETLNKDLETAKADLTKQKAKFEQNEIKRQEDMEALKADVKKDERKQLAAALKQDIRKYEDIVSSPSVASMEVNRSAWKALAAKYPNEAKDVAVGDTEELQFRVNYGGITNSIGMRFVLVQSGNFQMGSPANEAFRSNDEERHKVILTKSFYLQNTEVTQTQWIKIMGGNPSEFKDGGSDAPVENVSWDDCQEFVRKLNHKESTLKYRLSTEAEWEYACRSGRASAFANGGITESGCSFDANLNDMGWYCANSRQKTHPAGQKKPNAWGLHDMHGNVWEWCQDWFGKYPSGQVTDPKGALFGPERVIRGGSCLNYAEKCRSAYRFSYQSNIKNKNIGFRVARSR
jgi:formylglycine-generating enzyme required for sulfatase activity